MTESAISPKLFGVPVLLGVLYAATGLSCASKPDASRTTEISLPNYPIYQRHVDSWLQKRCGTLDCHGQPGRAYRLYGFSGFRLYNVDAGLLTGQQATSPAETRANFDAFVSLDPEEFSRVLEADVTEMNRLLVIRKALNLERHKGGAVMSEDDNSYRCLRAWLRANPAAETTLPAEDIKFCTDANNQP